MAITIEAMGSATLEKKDNDFSEVTITEAGVLETDLVLIQETSALPVDLKYKHSIYVSDVSADTIKVKSTFKDLPSNITFDYVVFREA